VLVTEDTFKSRNGDDDDDGNNDYNDLYLRQNKKSINLRA